MAKLYCTSKLGDFVVAFGIATRRQVESIRKGLKPTEMLGQALVKADVIDRERLERIVLVQRLFQKAAREHSGRGIALVLSEKSFLGEILIALGFLSLEENQKWLTYQAEKRAKGEDPGRLGELLVENQVVSCTERDLAMQVQDWLRGAR